MVSLRRPNRNRQVSWNLHDTSSLDAMSIANSERSTSSSTRARARDTGFPESFCGNKNTSLPHPDADTSPNASIGQDDIAVSRVLSRHRRSFLAKNSKRTISYGRITAEMEQMYSMGSSSSPTAAAASNETSPNVSQAAQLASSRRPSSGGADSVRSGSTTGEHEDAAPNSPPRVGNGEKVGRGRRRSILEKLGIVRHHV